MKHVHVAALEAGDEIAKKLGKKSGESDFCIYSCKASSSADDVSPDAAHPAKGDRVLSIYQPAKYPDRVQPLLYCLSICDVAYLRPAAIDKQVGEMIVAAALFGKKLLVLADLVGKDELEPLLKSAGLSDYEFFEGDINALRERLLDEKSLRKSEGNTEVLIDSCFPVKGVGTVALGIVEQGKVSVHQKLEFALAGISAEVKSIQVHDENVSEAEAGSRVGLCLKGIEPDRIERGELAAGEMLVPAKKIAASVSLAKFFKGDFCAIQFFALSGLKFTPCKAKRDGERYEIEFGSPLCARKGDELVLFMPEAMPRVIGKAKVLEA